MKCPCWMAQPWVGWRPSLPLGWSSRPPRGRLHRSWSNPCCRTRGNSVITATPADCFGVVGIIDFPQAAIGRQQFALQLTPQRFVDEIAPARTFGFREQVEELRAAGLIQGGALDNASGL